MSWVLLLGLTAEGAVWAHFQAARLRPWFSVLGPTPSHSPPALPALEEGLQEQLLKPRTWTHGSVMGTSGDPRGSGVLVPCLTARSAGT